MPLGPGTRLGPYEILSAIGAGGMGEVYRARDSKLGRDVAIKVLPSALTSDPNRLARFEREAQVLASLNHPNIAAIHHVEETADGPALVMEFVEGETLADRIARGPIPVDEALAIAQQIAEALEAAHAQGIIHRDLKPANVKITLGGTVKVLDFGLAKLVESDARPTSLTMSPTLSVQATYAGVILGTAAYMSPEQARGRQVDRRTDIWAFGCVLYEMLAGTKPFGGEDLAETIGAVIHKDPVWSQLPAVTPAVVRTVLQLCLQKDPKRRLRDIGDACLALDGAFDMPPAIQPVSQETVVHRRAVIALAVGTALLAGSLVTGIVVWFMTRPAHFEVTRTTIALTGPTALTAVEPIATWR